MPEPDEVASISLPGVAVSRAFTIEVRTRDGGLLTTHPDPLALAVAYDDADVGIAGGDVDKLRILRWDPSRAAAVVLPTTVDRNARSLSARTDHTSLFLIAAVPIGAPAEIAALASAPWGSDPIAVGPIPSRMPRVGGEPTAAAWPSWRELAAVAAATVLAALAIAGATLPSAVEHEPQPEPTRSPERERRRRRRRRSRWRFNWRPRRWYLLLLVPPLLLALTLFDQRARLVAGTLLQMPRLVGAIGGFGQPASVLLIGQNADEPRPTGGFMGSMGLVSIENGRLRTFDYRNSNEWEDGRAGRVLAPMPLERYGGLGGWLMRDANWSPDFPSSMREIDWFWRRDQPTRPAAAIAFTEETLAILLRATGPVRIPETGEVVDAANVRRWILYQLYPLGPDGRPVYVVGAKTQVLSSLARAAILALHLYVHSAQPAEGGRLWRRCRHDVQPHRRRPAV